MFEGASVCSRGPGNVSSSGCVGSVSLVVGYVFALSHVSSMISRFACRRSLWYRQPPATARTILQTLGTLGSFSVRFPTVVTSVSDSSHALLAQPRRYIDIGIDDADAPWQSPTFCPPPLPSSEKSKLVPRNDPSKCWRHSITNSPCCIRRRRRWESGSEQTCALKVWESRRERIRVSGKGRQVNISQCSE